MRTEVVEDWPPSRETIVDVVPIVDAGLPQFPAQIDFAVIERRREIDQSDLEVFDLATDLLEGLDGLAQLLHCLVLLLATLEHGHGVDLGTAGEVNLRRDLLQMLIDRCGFALRFAGLVQPLLDEGDRAFGFFQGEHFRHRSIGSAGGPSKGNHVW